MADWRVPHGFLGCQTILPKNIRRNSELFHQSCWAPQPKDAGQLPQVAPSGTTISSFW